MNRAFELARRDRKRLLRSMTRHATHLVIYAADTAALRPPEPAAGLELRPLTAEDLRGLSVRDASFCSRQIERVDRFGASYAYAVLADGQVAHISWLLPPAAMKRDVPRVLRPREDEAEITGSETLPSFRGRGIYGFAIRGLADAARRRGVRRVLMKAATGNSASRRGMEKSGLLRVGWAILITLPGVRRPLVLCRYS